jgi:hypothetical protein
MSKRKKLEDKVEHRISLRKCDVFLRGDFEDLGGYDQIGRAIKNLVRKGLLIKIGYGLYAKAKISPLNGSLLPRKRLPLLAREALDRLGVKASSSRIEKDYKAGRSTQVPTGRLIAVNKRISRKIGYNGAYVSFEWQRG